MKQLREEVFEWWFDRLFMTVSERRLINIFWPVYDLDLNEIGLFSRRLALDAGSLLPLKCHKRNIYVCHFSCAARRSAAPSLRWWNSDAGTIFWLRWQLIQYDFSSRRRLETWNRRPKRIPMQFKAVRCAEVWISCAADVLGLSGISKDLCSLKSSWSSYLAISFYLFYSLGCFYF